MGSEQSIGVTANLCGADDAGSGGLWHTDDFCAMTGQLFFFWVHSFFQTFKKQILTIIME
jgi:hypothetical protein